MDLFRNRVPEELYDYEIDPDALVNLIDDPRYKSVLAGLRQQLANEMFVTDDFLLREFENEFSVRGVAAEIH